MAPGVLLLALGAVLYDPADWQFYPSMDEVRCISAGARTVYIGVPGGVYAFDRTDHRHLYTITRADGVDGEVRLCADYPARGGPLVVTDRGVYQYVTATRKVLALDPPFEDVYSLGVTDSGAYFDTDRGTFFRHPVRPDFKRVGTAPDDATWYGQRDTTRPRDFPFLTPYFLTDRRLDQHPITLVRRSGRTREVYVAADRYGVDVFRVVTGFADTHIRLGPQRETIRRVTRAQDRLWFVSDDYVSSVDSRGNWDYFRSLVTDLPVPEFLLLSPGLRELRRKEGINAFISDSQGTLVATDRDVYSVDAEGRPTPLFGIDRPVYGLARRGDTTLVGTDAGLFALAGDSVTELHDPDDRTGLGVYAMAHSDDGSTYLGTLGGFVILDSAGRWRELTPPGFDLSRPVERLAATGGFLFFESGDDIEAYDVVENAWHDILPPLGGPVDALYADSGSLWIATRGAVSRFAWRNVLDR